MGETTGISWCDHTFNGWIGCFKVSPGCKNCYAETLAKNRMGLDVWGPPATTARKPTSASYWLQPHRWNRAAERDQVRRRVFCGSMCDWAEDHPDLVEPRARLFDLIRETPWLDWLLLSKRMIHERIMELLPSDWGHGYPNVWMGTSVENQEYADQRIPELIKIPAVVRFLSCEPLLGPIDLSPFLGYNPSHDKHTKDRRKDISGSTERGDRNPPRRNNLEGSDQNGGTMGDSPVVNHSASQSGAHSDDGLSPGPSIDRGAAVECSCTSSCVLPLQWTDPGRVDSESQEWDQERQSSYQLGFDDILRTTDSRTPHIASGKGGSKRGKKRDGEINPSPSSKHTNTKSKRGGPDFNSSGFQCVIPGNIQNLSGRSVALIHWTIVGGESGTGYRPMDLAWARSIRDQCTAEEIPFFYKQAGGLRPGQGAELDGQVCHQFPEQAADW